MRFLIAIILAGCSFDPAGVETPGDDEPFDAARSDDAPVLDDAPPPTGRYRKSITVPSSSVSGTLADFPIFVELTDTDLRDHASQIGAELHFVAADGATPLDHEVQRWEPSTGHLEAWVRIPALADTAATTIYLRYGAFDDAVPDPAAVWQNGFVAVWHLEDAPDGTAGDIADALGAADATSASMNTSNRVDAVVGRGLGFADDLEQLTFINPLAGASTHTISAWVDQQASDHNSALVVLGNGACGQARWLHARFDGGPAAAGFYCDDWTTTGVDLQGDGFALVHWTYAAGASSRLYRDGALVAGPFTHAGAQSTQGAVGTIGNAPAAFGAEMNLVGVADEIRIADVARSADWIATEHANQSAPADFYAVGAEEELP